MDANSNGVIDLKEDGSYAWKFVGYVVGQSVAMNANTNYYTTMAPASGATLVERSAFVTAAFHGIGNVNYAGGYGVSHEWYLSDATIDLIGDLAPIATSLTSNIGGAWGPGPVQYNPDADLDNNGNVNILDLGIAGANFGKRMG